MRIVISTLVCLVSGCSASNVAVETKPIDAAVETKPVDAAVAVAQSDTKSAPATTVIVDSEQAPTQLAIDAEFVYWIASGELRRAPLDGGVTQTIAMVSSLEDLAAADGSAFYTNPTAGTVVRIDRDLSEHVIGHGVKPSGLAVYGGQVFWVNSGMTIGEQADGSIASVNIDGSDERVLLGGLNMPSSVAVNAEHIYFSGSSQMCRASSPPSPQDGCLGGGVVALPRAGGASIVIDPHATAADLVLGPQTVSWVDARPTRVVSAALAGTRPAGTRVETVDESPGSLAVDDTALYFASAAYGRVLKLPHTGSELTRIAVDLGERIGDIAVDARGVYVAATSLGQILRFAKDGSAARTEPITGPCPLPLGAAEDIAASPRADKNLEQLALQLDSERVVASQETYDRVLADVQAIRKLDTQLADVTYTAHDDAQTIMLTLSDLALQSVKDGKYSAWDCLTSFYGLVSQNTMTSFGNHYVELKLEGNFNLELLAEQVFAKLPGVTAAERGNSSGGDGPTICARRQGATIDYVVDRRDGDCWLHCTIHRAKHFVSSAKGTVEARETWDSEAQMSVPDWYNQICTEL